LPNTTKVDLIYRGSRDSFKANIFHKKCDNKGPTLSIIKSEHGKVFLFYTDISWSSDEGEKINGNNSFIISI
jgi:hypothetical protein